MIPTLRRAPPWCPFLSFHKPKDALNKNIKIFSSPKQKKTQLYWIKGSLDAPNTSLLVLSSIISYPYIFQFESVKIWGDKVKKKSPFQFESVVMKTKKNLFQFESFVPSQGNSERVSVKFIWHFKSSFIYYFFPISKGSYKYYSQRKALVSKY